MSGGNADLQAADIALPKIPATAWAVLGILSFGRELTGYDIKNWSDAILHFFYWSPATSQIYTELRRLEDLGLVSSRTVARDEVRDKTIYAITPIGTEALRSWQATVDAEAPVLKHGVLLRIWLGHLAEPDRLREQIAEHRARLHAELTAAKESQEQADAQPDWAYPALVASWAVRRIESEMELTDSMLIDLDRLANNR
ncbi:MAG: PadR family transcriptional regulator [Actinobacteria bacterium]|jgi:DNA-binding PadR family transcriptional regulator|nr:PadR family transcriptional regulator [Actinomycetota bacterium]